jgi:hypothetical protein
MTMNNDDTTQVADGSVVQQPPKTDEEIMAELQAEEALKAEQAAKEAEAAKLAQEQAKSPTTTRKKPAPAVVDPVNSDASGSIEIKLNRPELVDAVFKAKTDLQKAQNDLAEHDAKIAALTGPKEMTLADYLKAS